MDTQPRHPGDRPRRAVRRAAVIATSVMLAVGIGGCADFSREQPTFTVQPTLTQPEARPFDPNPASPSPSSGQTPPSPSPGASPTGPTVPPDPCVPTDPAVIAACLAAPWGLVVLPDAQSALVGERTTGRVLLVAPKMQPVEFATVPGIDTANGGGLLGMALSPSYGEDGLVYAFITTRTDSRIVRFAKGEKPKAIFTGIPRGTTHIGGQIAFGVDGQLYVGTGDGGTPAAAANPKSLAGKVLRLDGFGKPAKGNPARSAVFASGFTDVAGMCSLPDGSIGALDHRKSTDVLLPIESGQNYTKLADGDALWTWKHSEGGAADCAIGDAQLANTSLDKEQVVGVQMTAQGGFTGSPEVLLDKKYGRLLTITVGGTGDQQLYWITTSNKDGKGKPVPADDRVIVLPSSGGGGQGGPD